MKYDEGIGEMVDVQDAIAAALLAIANELAEANRLKRIELKVVIAKDSRLAEESLERFKELEESKE